MKPTNHNVLKLLQNLQKDVSCSYDGILQDITNEKSWQKYLIYL